MNKVWIWICPILGLLLLLSVCPPSNFCESQEKSYNVFFKQENSKLQEKRNSDNGFFKQAKCIDGSNFFLEEDSGILNVDLTKWHEGPNISTAMKKIKIRCNDNCNSTYDNSECQEKGNSFKFKFKFHH